jgi:hypothetical protein
MDEETRAAREEAERIAAEPELGASDLIAAAPGLARIAADTAWRATAWSAGIYARTGRSILRAATSGESATELLQQAEAELAGYLRGLGEMLETESDAGRAYGSRRNGSTATDETADCAEALRERGAELLRASAEVDESKDEYHPAYARILEALAPDEARILRLMAIEGAQPAVDIRSGLPVAIGSELIELGQTMIGAEAGLLHTERVKAYLNNLFRLGLVWFSREPVSDPLRYQVLEAQPDVTQALAKAGRFGRTVRRSIQLTPFGVDFCQTCLPLDTADFAVLGREEGGEVKTKVRFDAHHGAESAPATASAPEAEVPAVGGSTPPSARRGGSTPAASPRP